MARKKRTTERTDSGLEEKPGGENPTLSNNEQSGDLQGLPDMPEADSQSVRELAAEGQAFEAMAVNAIENAPPADEGELKPREVPEDDVPPEYTDRAKDEPKEE